MDDPDGDHCLIVSVWVDAKAEAEEVIFGHTRDATMSALKQGAAGGPWHPNLVAVETPENEYFRRTGWSDLSGRLTGRPRKLPQSELGSTRRMSDRAAPVRHRDP